MIPERTKTLKYSKYPVNGFCDHLLSIKLNVKLGDEVSDVHDLLLSSMGLRPSLV